MQTTMHQTYSSTSSNNSLLFPKKKKGEPHRIYWQQWIATKLTKEPNSSNSHASSNSNPDWATSVVVNTDGVNQKTTADNIEPKKFNRRELIISSAAIRLSRSAKVIDVTTLLRQTINLPVLPITTTSEERHNHMNEGSSTTSSSQQNEDCLVLVGTIYSLHQGFIQYQHTLVRTSEQQQQQQRPLLYGEPYHIVHTLQADENPLLAYEMMEKYITNFLDKYDKMFPLATNTNTIATDIAQTSTNTTAVAATTAITPKIQWYYLPAVDPNDTNTLIPNCIELDGYCTSLNDNSESYGDDDDDDDDKRTDDMETTNSSSEEKLCSVFPWIIDRRQRESVDSTTSTDIDENLIPSLSSSLSLSSRPYSRLVQRKLRHQEYLYNELCLSEAQTPPHACITGYLLYRSSPIDLHVWTRMYCILTNHELWFVSRIFTRMDDTNRDGSYEVNTYSNRTYRYVRHGRIRLTRAILIQPTLNTEPSLVRIPYAFEVVASDGASHIFRTGTKYQQTIWMSSISERIITSYECSLLENADLIMSDECYARNRRATTIAVEPLWDQTMRLMSDNNIHHHRLQQPPLPSIGNSVDSVLRFGMDVVTYKNRCRFVRSTMPTRTPIIVAATPTSQLLRRRFFSSSSVTASVSRDSSRSDVQYEPYDAHIQGMIRITWNQAIALLARARSLALTLHVRSSIIHRHDANTTDDHGNEREQPSTIEPESGTMTDRPRARVSHGVDTLCRHIEFILTGRLDAAASQTSTTTTQVVDKNGIETILENKQQQEDGPPPDDLFDHLLTELQAFAASADFYHGIKRVGATTLHTPPLIR